MAPSVQPGTVDKYTNHAKHTKQANIHQPEIDVAHLTPASLACPQLWFRLYEQLNILGSLPTHWMLFATMGPVPLPKTAPYKGVAAAHE